MGRRPHTTLCLFLGPLLVLSVCVEDRASEKAEGDKVKAKKTEGDKVKAKVAKGEIVPELDRCTIDVEGRIVKPVKIPAPRPGGHVAGGLRLQLEGGTIRAFGKGEVKARWSAKAPDGVELVWLTADDSVDYLAGYKADKESGDLSPELPLRVRRLEIASGKWLDDLAVDTKPRPKGAESIQAVLTGDARIVVLTVTADEDKGGAGGRQKGSYRVICFKGKKPRPAWSRSIRSAGKVRQPGAVLLWAAGAPAKVRPDVQQLAWIGEDVLVCAGPVQDLLRLEGGTGKECWRVERVWENERGFIGPSVWQHLFYRPVEQAGEKEKAASGRRNSVIGGPVVVDVPRGRRGDRDQRIFVAVAKEPASEFGEYVADCVVYELDSNGKPLAMVKLPRMMRGGRYGVQKGGVVWACHGGAFAKVAVTRNVDRRLGMGPGGSDLLCRVEWYRHISVEEPDAWLTAAPAGDPVVFGVDYAFRVCAGGYVTSPDAEVYCFPLSMIDLKTGVDRAMVVRVPYKGKLPEPETNFSRTQSPKGGVQWRALGPHILAITGLQLDGKRLRVTMGMETWSRDLEFDIGELRDRDRK